MLITTAVAAEAEAFRAGLPVAAELATVAPAGVGPAAAGAGCARLLALAEAAGRPYRTVVSAGIGGGFAGRAPVGATVLARRSIHADLGAESPDGFLPLAELGLGGDAVVADPELVAALARAMPEAVVGDVLTVATVTGTADRASALAATHPEAAAEAMEGYGAGCAAAAAGTAFAELRTISNPVGPRDRAAWHIEPALTALTSTAAALRVALDLPV